MKVIIDTNVALVANKNADQASPTCVLSCVSRLREIQLQHVVVIDDGWHILREYQNKLRSEGQPGVGDAFLLWLLTNRARPERCEQVTITPVEADSTFAQFPKDPALQHFDPSDRKFVAVALAHPDHPPILNAVDSDWWHYQATLAGHGVRIEFLCPDAEPKQKR